MPDRPPFVVTWTLHEESLLAMLNRVYHGETPDEVYMEMYVNMLQEGESPGR